MSTMSRQHLAMVAVQAVAAAALAGATDTVIVVEGTLETSLGQPMVHVQLSDGRRVLTGRATELEQLLGEADEIVR